MLNFSKCICRIKTYVRQNSAVASLSLTPVGAHQTANRSN